MAHNLLLVGHMNSHHKLQFSAREWNLAYRVALRVLRAADQAEDAAQDALMQAYLARNNFSGRSKPESWLHRIAFNTAISHLRRPATRRRSGADVFSVMDRSSARHAKSTSPEQHAIAGQIAGSLKDCMSEMRPKDRIAFTERFLLGTSEKELGQLLGVSTNAAKQRAFRARRTVRGCLSCHHADHQG